MNIDKWFPRTDKNGHKIVYGLRDCCNDGSEAYGPHKTWCRYFEGSSSGSGRQANDNDASQTERPSGG